VTVGPTAPTASLDGWLERHPNVVIDVHAVVPHTTSMRIAVAEKSKTPPKLSPETVIEVDALHG